MREYNENVPMRIHTGQLHHWYGLTVQVLERNVIRWTTYDDENEYIAVLTYSQAGNFITIVSGEVNATPSVETFAFTDREDAFMTITRQITQDIVTLSKIQRDVMQFFMMDILAEV